MENTRGESLAACRAGLCWAGGDSSHRTVLYCTVLYCTVHLHPSLQPNIDLVSAGAGPLVWLVLEPGVTTAHCPPSIATQNPGNSRLKDFCFFLLPLHFIEMSVSCGRDTGGARGSPAPVEARRYFAVGGGFSCSLLIQEDSFCLHLLCPWRPFSLRLF